MSPLRGAKRRSYQTLSSALLVGRGSFLKSMKLVVPYGLERFREDEDGQSYEKANVPRNREGMGFELASRRRSPER